MQQKSTLTLKAIVLSTKVQTYTATWYSMAMEVLSSSLIHSFKVYGESDLPMTMFTTSFIAAPFPTSPR